MQPDYPSRNLANVRAKHNVFGYVDALIHALWWVMGIHNRVAQRKSIEMGRNRGRGKWAVSKDTLPGSRHGMEKSIINFQL